MSRSESLDKDQQCEGNLNRYYNYNYVKRKGFNKPAITQYDGTYSYSENEPHHSKFNSSQNLFFGNADTKENKNTDQHNVSNGYTRVINNESSKKQWSNEAKVTFQEDNTESRQNFHQVPRGQTCYDKTTYCRPAVNLFNPLYLYKTIEKNARLQRLVKDLIIARQREKAKENWNNYINKLKEKHCDGVNRRRAISLHYVPKELVTNSIIEDCYKTKFVCKQSHLSHNMLQDLYDAHYVRQPNNSYYNSTMKDYCSTCETDYYPFKTNSYCYPTSSQGRLLVLERERQNQLLLNRCYNKMLHRTDNEEATPDKDFCNKGNMKSTKKANQNLLFQRKGDLISYDHSTNTTENTSTQTESQMHPISNKIMQKMVENKSNSVSKSIGTNESDNVKILHDSVLKQNSLESIEKKLDTLINSINSFILEVKSKRSTKRNKCLNTKSEKENVNFTRSDSFGLATREKIVCGLVNNSSNSTAYSSDANINKIKNIDCNLAKINDIISKALDKNKLVTLKDSCVGEIYHPCSVQISVQIPTKEISTEVTSSLSKAEYTSGVKNVIIDEINPPTNEDRRIAMAVNTDPLSLLALLRVSTEETIRRLLSYVPSIDYYYYLSRLQGPQISESQYICNICGASFMKPSELTDHIQKHELGRTRDCCVCRHVLDMPRRRTGLFKCQYCGQRFTRAYCCELHQQSCARRLGITHDVASSLMLLK